MKTEITEGFRECVRTLHGSYCLVRDGLIGGTSQKHLESFSKYTCWAHPRDPESGVMGLKLGLCFPPSLQKLPRGFCCGHLVRNQEVEELGSTQCDH